MTWFRTIWPFAWPKPRTRRRPFGLYAPRRRSWRDRLGCLAARVVDAFAKPWTPGRRHTLWGWVEAGCFLAFAAIAAGALWIYAPPAPSTRDLSPAGAQWFVPVDRMPATDPDPEPPLRVERRTTWCPQPR